MLRDDDRSQRTVLPIYLHQVNSRQGPQTDPRTNLKWEQSTE